MKDERKTKKQLIQELQSLREKVNMGESERSGMSIAEQARIFDHVHDAILVFEPENEIILEANPAACRIYDVPHGELVGRSLQEFSTDPEYGQQKVEQTLASAGGSLQFETSQWDAKGRLIIWEINATVMEYQGRPAILSIGRDITSRRQREAELRASEERYRTLTENTFDLICDLDYRGVFHYVSPNVKRLLGYMQEELINRPFLALVHPEDRSRIADVFRVGPRALTGNRVEFRARRKEGRTIWMEASGRPYHTEKGEIHVVVISRDVTERKKDEALTRVQAEITEAAAASGDLTELIGTVRQNLGALFDTTNFYVALYDEKEGLYSFPYSEDERDRLEEFERQPLEGSLTDYVRRTGTPLIVTEESERQLWDEGEVELVGASSAVWMGAPLVTDRGVLGVVVVQDYHDPEHYDTRDLDLLNYVAGHIAVAVERKRALDALRDSQGMLRLVMDNIPQLVFWKDRNSVFLGCNRRFARAAGFDDPEDLVGLTEHDLAWTRDESSHYVAMDQQVMETDEPVIGYVEHLTQADGREVWIESNKVPLHDESGHVIGVLGTSEDITEKRFREAELRRLKDFNEAIVQSMADGIAVEDRSGNFVFVNPALAQMLGYREEDMIGLHWTAIVPPSHHAVVEAANERRRLGESDRYELLLVGKDGRRVNALVSGKPLQDDLNVRGLLAVFTDVTERKRAERERRELEEKLFQSQKMETIGRLAGGVAHDFNNLLAIIRGHTDIALMTLDKDHPQRAQFNLIRRTTDRAANLIRQLLIFGRRQALQPQELNLNDVIIGVQSMLEQTIGDRVALELELHDGLWPVMADPGQLEQVLINMAVNSRDAMPYGGTFTITTANWSWSRVKQEGDPTLTPGDYVVVHIRDTGTGIPNEHLESIFEPFFTTKEEGHGSGLGLASVYSIVQQTRGEIRVESQVGEGTVFHLFFPRKGD